MELEAEADHERSLVLEGDRHRPTTGQVFWLPDRPLPLPSHIGESRRTCSGIVRVSSPVTAAGPQRICTVFPILQAATSSLAPESTPESTASGVEVNGWRSSPRGTAKSWRKGTGPCFRAAHVRQSTLLTEKWTSPRDFAVLLDHLVAILVAVHEVPISAETRRIGWIPEGINELIGVKASAEEPECDKKNGFVLVRGSASLLRVKTSD